MFVTLLFGKFHILIIRNHVSIAFQSHFNHSFAHKLQNFCRDKLNKKKHIIIRFSDIIFNPDHAPKFVLMPTLS